MGFLPSLCLEQWIWEQWTWELSDHGYLRTLLIISQTVVIKVIWMFKSHLPQIDCNISKQSDWLSSAYKEGRSVLWVQCQRVVSLRLIPSKSKPEKWYLIADLVLEYNNRAPDNIFLSVLSYCQYNTDLVWTKYKKCTNVLVPVLSFSVHKPKVVQQYHNIM